MLCPKCSRKMKNVMHFEENRKYQFNQCPWCLYKTKNKRMHLDEEYKNTRHK